MKQLILLLFPLYFLYPQITGIVLDASNDHPLSGVNITSGETGTASDYKGRFTLNVQSRDEVTFSHIGYQTQIIKAHDNMSVAMIETVVSSKGIIVHAGLSEEYLQQKASSVTILTSRDIKRNSSEHFQVLTDQIPNLNWAGGTSRPRYFQIRGIGERSHYFGEGPPNFSVGFVLDDMDLSGLGMVGLLYDIDQVEVFKGPQSTIYGSNAMAGLISLHSVDPTNEFNTSSSVSLGSDNHHRIGFSLNVPLDRDKNLRIGGLNNYTDGFRKNVSQNVTDTNKRDEILVRVKLRFQPAQTLSVLGTFMVADLKNGYDAWTPDNNTDLKTYSNNEGKDSQKTYGYSLRAHFTHSDKINITSITSFTETDLIHAYDGDWADSTYWHDNHNFDPAVEGWAYEFYDKNERKRANLSQEIRLSLGSIILGGYSKYLKEQDDARGYLFGGIATDAWSAYAFKAMAGYAQFEHDLSPAIKLKTNVRFEKNMMDYEGISEGLNENWEKVVLPPVEFKVGHSMLGYRGSIHYLKDKFTSFYCSVSQGYKSGGVNQQPYLSDENRPFDPEFIQNFEVGLKRVTDIYRNQVSVFYSKRKDQQVSISSQQDKDNPNSFLFYTENAGSGWTRGMEWENTYTITKKTQLFITLGYLDTWVDEFSYQLDTANVGTGGNRETAMAPKVTGSVGLNYHSGVGIFASVQLTHKEEYYFSDSHNKKSAPFSLLNLTVGKTFQNATFKFWVRNMLDERYVVRGFYFGLIPPTYPNQLWKSYGDPVQFGMTLDYNFN